MPPAALTYYQARTPGDGEFDYFILQPDGDGWGEGGYDPLSLVSAVGCARENQGWVVRIEEQTVWQTSGK